MFQPLQIAITGLGAVTPFGVGVDVFWDAIIAGQSSLSTMSDAVLAEYTPVVAQLTDFDASAYLGRKLAKNTDRFTHFALVAANEALRDAGFLNNSGEFLGAERAGITRDEVGVSLGSAFGGVQSLEDGAVELATGSSKRVSPRLVSKAIPNAGAAAIAKQYGFRGPVLTTVTACASAANAIGECRHWFLDGTSKVVLAGGSEHLFTPAILAGLRAAGAIAVKGPEDVRKWSRPFDKYRQGMIMGEGAALLVLEPLHQAERRGAKIYGILSGYGASNDAYHETSPDPEGSGALLAMERALKNAGLTAENIDYVNAHATATPAGDAAEAHALRRLFGDRIDRVPVSSIKGSIGHMLGTAGAIEGVACLKALETGWLPPTLNCDTLDDEMPADIVPQSRRQALRHVLSNSFGFGGQNGVLVFSSRRN